MPTSKKEAKQVKQPKTIKVSTIIIAVAVIAALVAAFIGGWVASEADQNRVHAEAKQMVSSLGRQ